MPESLRRLVDALPQPAYVTGRRWDVLAWNSLAESLFRFGRLPEEDRNILIHLLTTPHARRSFGKAWASQAQHVIAQFRTSHDQLQLPAGVRLPEPPLYVKATLVFEGDEDGLDFGGAAFDERREIVCRAPGPGRLRVRWIAEKRGSSGSSATVMDGIPPQFVDLPEDAGEPLFVLTVDDATLREALANCGL